MKKTLIASAVLLGMGGAINQAVGDVEINPDGIGDKFFIPYYTTKSGNTTLISITNTSDDAKVMKVRFREAMGSEDALDFQVWLSPKDVWSGGVTQDAGTGLPKIVWDDSSCTTPVGVPNGDGREMFPFSTARIPGSFAGSAAERVREGYVEIFEMASFLPGDTLYQDTLHFQGANPPVPPCLIAEDFGLGSPGGAIVAPPAASTGIGMTGNPPTPHTFRAPTGGVYAYALLINVPQAGAHGYEAVALNNDGDRAPRYFPQSPILLSNTLPLINGNLNVADFTLDGKLLNGQIAGQLFDLPDMSTPFEFDMDGSMLANASFTPHTTDGDLNLDTPYEQIVGNVTSTGISDEILAQALMNDYLTLSSINGATDFIINMPTKRYHVMGRPGGSIIPPFSATFNEVTGQACEAVNLVFYNREESEAMPEPDDIVISPNPPPEVVNVVLCGEANVAGFNVNGAPTSAVEAEQVVSTVMTTVNIGGVDVASEEGWANYDLTFGNTRSGLPVAGFAAYTASTNPAAGAVANFGAAVDHKFVRSGARTGATLFASP